MRGRLRQCVLAIIFVCTIIVPVKAEGEAASTTINLKTTDSVNVKQMLLSQIIKAKEKMQTTTTRNTTLAAAEKKISNSVTTDNSVKGTAGITDDVFMKVFVLVDAALGAFLFILWRRRKLNINKAEKTHLKENITKLRHEKVGMKSDTRLDSYRKQIKIDPMGDPGIDEQYLIKHARKLSVSVGELQLAARIKSYQRETA